jgi:hypothetical protein
VGARLRFPEVGLHQRRSEKNSQGALGRGPPVPSHVPTHPQTTREGRDLSPTATGFTAERDSLAEEGGFELPVPVS